MVGTFNRWKKLHSDIEEAQILLDDPDMKEMAAEEIEANKAEIEQLEQHLQILLLPKDPNDEYNCFLEIRAGTGGDEAGIFAGDLYRMYSRYAESKRWRIEELSANESEQGGYKEIIVKISGEGVYGQLKFESGGHRVQRVPKTESQGRIHTSACTVAVMPELPESEMPEINLRICVLTPTAHQVQVVSTLIPPTLRCVLPTFQQVLWWSVKTNVHSTKTKPKPLRYLLHALFKLRKKNKRKSRRILAVTYLAQATVQTKSVLTTTHKGV